MSHILVVDDSLVDRELAGALLRKSEKYHVEYAGNGIEALEHLEARLPLAVLTDLNMPEMDGIQLVKAIRDALSQRAGDRDDGGRERGRRGRGAACGASDYIPKVHLGKELVESVECVLALKADDRLHQRLAGCLREERLCYELENDVLLFAPFAEQCQNVALGLSLVDEAESRRMGRALIEVLSNALYHGNLEMPPEQIPKYHRAGESAELSSRLRERRTVIGEFTSRRNSRRNRPSFRFATRGRASTSAPCPTSTQTPPG